MKKLKTSKNFALVFAIMYEILHFALLISAGYNTRLLITNGDVTFLGVIRVVTILLVGIVMGFNAERCVKEYKNYKKVIKCLS